MTLPKAKGLDARRRLALQAAFAVPCSLLVPLTASGQAAAPKPGSPLPLVDLPLLEGGTFKASEANGKVAVLYWWASWCPFCAEMTPHVEKLWREQRDRGLVVLGLSIDQNREAAIAHRRKRGYTFPSAQYEPGLERFLPKPKAVPTTWVRSREGRLLEVIPGQMFPEDVAELAKHL